MIRLFALLIGITFFIACDNTKTTADTTTNLSSDTEVTTASLDSLGDGRESKSELKALTEYSNNIRETIFRMRPRKSLPYYIEKNEFQVEIYKDENGDTLALVSNGILGKYGEYDTYLFYRDNRPYTLFMKNLKRDISTQKFSEKYAFFDEEGNMKSSSLSREDPRDNILQSKVFESNKLNQSFKAPTFSQEFIDALEMKGRYKLYFKEIYTKEGRQYVRFKTNSGIDLVANSYQSYIRIPEEIKDNTLNTIIKKPKNYVGKAIELEWQEVKDPDGRLTPEWVSGEVVAE